MSKPVVVAALLGAAALMPGPAQAQCCWRTPVAAYERAPIVVYQELPALEVAPGVYVTGKPAGPRIYPYASQGAYWWAYRHAWFYGGRD